MLGRQIFAVFWAVSALVQCAVRIESVVTDVNAADPPSRACKLTSKPAETTVDHVPPESSRQIFEAETIFLQPQYGLGATSVGFGNPFPCEFDRNAADAAEIATD